MFYFRRAGQGLGLLLSSLSLEMPAMAASPPSPPDTAPSTQTLPKITIEGNYLPDLASNPPGSTTLKEDQLKEIRNRITDSSELLKNLPGVSLYGAGRISSLPVLNGMADDRVATVIDGMRVSADCPNHMNPALSYIDPHDVDVATVMAGITPVSMGGDSLGGTIEIKRKDPQFSKKTDKILVTGRVSSFYHSNGRGLGASGSTTVANEHLSIRYDGAWSQSRNYKAGAGGHQVRSTKYKNFNHAVTLGYHKENHLLSLTVGQSDTPYEGFPNQYMDMTNNRSTFVNGNYKGDFDWGTLEAKGYWQRVSHVMNKLNDKGGHSPTTGMPMNVNSRLAGYSLKATIYVNDRDTIRVGSGFDHSGLNDWWPPLQNSMMMGPYTYHNINNGHRNRLGHFAEWEANWTPKVTTLLGLRSDVVMMNTDKVSGYQGLAGMNTAEHNAIQNFNNANRGKTDTNFDVTALTRWNISNSFSWEGGYARKTRSPNLYERYSWGNTNMASRMIGWFGDGNGYVGNVHLKPEIGNTISTTFNWHDPNHQKWELKVQPFYTYIHHYINTNYLSSIAGPKGSNAHFSKLQFANHNAQIYGVNTSGFYQLWNSKNFGKGNIKANLNWVRGQDLISHNSLYHMMPLNGTISLNEFIGPWTGMMEVTMVNSKTLVDSMRNEPKTPGYILFNLGGSYTWRVLRIDASIENLMNKKYYLPLGGWSLGDLNATNNLRALPGIGRSFNLSLTANF